jgi:hypothetical protein
MKFLTSLLLFLCLAVPAAAQTSAPADPQLTHKQVSELLQPVMGAKGGYALHATENRQGYEIAFFGTWTISDDNIQLTLASSYDGEKKALTPLDDDKEVFNVTTVSSPNDAGKKDGVVLLLILKYQPTDNTAPIYLRVAVFNTGRLIGMGASEAGSRFSIVGAPTAESDFVSTFLPQAEALHDAVIQDRGEHSSQFFLAWAQNKPLPLITNEN